MATTTVSISNLALQRLGQTSISALDDTGLLPEQCNLVYQPTVFEMLESYDWPFAIKRDQLGFVETPTSNYTSYAYTYTNPLLGDAIKVLAILDGFYNDSTSDWMIEDQYLYTDEINPLYYKYIDNMLAEEANFPDLFVTVVYLRMAMKMCIKITQDQNLLSQITQEFAMAYQVAQSTLGVNNKQSKQPTERWSV